MEKLKNYIRLMRIHHYIKAGLPMKGRSSKYDNIRAFLMFSVVFLHFLELCSGVEGLYCINVMFVMPAFVFLSGYFARYRPGAFLKRLALPYLALQAGYITFARVVLGSGEPYQFTVPYWLLWYLPALFMWGMLLPAIDTDSPGRMAAVLLGLTGLALAAGFDGSINRSMTLSRALVFFPYYAAGVYARKIEVRASPAARRLFRVLAVCGAAFSAWLAVEWAVPREVIYGASSYADSGGNPGLRLFLYLAGACWIALFFLLFPDRNIPGVTALGRNTMPVYLFHGFIVRLAYAWGLFRFSPAGNLWLAVALSAAVCAALGNGRLAGLGRGGIVKQ